MDTTTSRRTVLVGTGLCALAACGLAGCVSYGPEEEPEAAESPAAPLRVPTSDIPAGGGKVFDDQKIVVTQPSPGEFKAFSAICTHQGCTVGEVTTEIVCPCHGSAFALADGSVVNGPATAPLPALNVSVSGSELTVS
jgi:Rieske Fe-S protein